MIELKQVTKRYGAVEAVRDISFTAPKGQIVGLVGEKVEDLETFNAREFAQALLA